MRSRFSVARRTVLAIALLAGSLVVLGSSAASGASAVGFQAPASVANQSGRLATASLYDLGNHTSALYAFASSGSAFSKQLFWKSARGKLDAAKAKLACGDLNADGYPDALVLYDRGGGKSALYAFLSDGSKYVKTTAWSGALAWGRAKLCLGDANGDGLADAYVLYQTSTTRSAVYLFTTQSKAAQLAVPPVVTMAKTTAWRAQPYASARAQIAATDVNADGNDELVSLYRVAASKARLDVFAASGAKLTRRSFWQGRLAAARARLACGDVDSDGKGDAVLLMNSGRRGSTLRVLKSRGTSFASPATWWKSGAGKLDWAAATLACRDVTSDGRADAVVLSATSRTKAKLTVAVSSGTAFAAESFWAGALRTAGARLACAPATPTVVPATT